METDRDPGATPPAQGRRRVPVMAAALAAGLAVGVLGGAAAGAFAEDDAAPAAVTTQGTAGDAPLPVQDGRTPSAPDAPGAPGVPRDDCPPGEGGGGGGGTAPGGGAPGANTGPAAGTAS